MSADAVPFHDVQKNVEIRTCNWDGVRPTPTYATIFRRQLFASSSHFIGSICFGMTVGFTGTLLPQIKDFVDTETGSWLASVIVLFMPVGNVVCSSVMRYHGRKISQILANAFWMVGWPLMAFLPPTVWTLLTGCAIVGFSAGMSASVCSVYVIEACEPRLRGMFHGFLGTAVAVGVLTSHVFGTLFKWRTALALSAVIPTAAFALSTVSLESPNWLVLKGRTAAAEKNFRWIRGRTPDSERELSALLSRQAENNRQNRGGVLENVFSNGFFKPFATLFTMFTVQQGSGLNVIVFFAIQMLQQMSKELDAPKCLIIIDLIRVIATVIACFVMKSMNRRMLYFSASSCTFFALISIIVITKYDFSATMLVISICFYIWSLHMGVVQLPWLLNAELYPAALREFGSGVTALYGCFATFAVVKTGPLMMKYLGVPLTFSVYAMIVLVGCCLLYIIMPETHNRTLQEVEDKLANSGNADVTKNANLSEKLILNGDLA